MKTTIQDGASAILGESVKILNDNKVDYIIVGGWSPFLLNSGKIPHPGTKDVDILFKSGAQEAKLESIIRQFLKKGFTQSAKHSFQLLKSININKIDFMFNIDLLHPGNHVEKPQMFVDQINFPVKESHTMKVNYKSKTIVLPKSDLFFQYFLTNYNYTFESIEGAKETVEIKLLDEAGLILSKIESVLNVKRTRDAFDIFLALKQNRNYSNTIEKLVKLAKSQKAISESVNSLSKNIDILDYNITEWCSTLNVSLPDREVHEVFHKFIDNFNTALHP